MYGYERITVNPTTREHYRILVIVIILSSNRKLLENNNKAFCSMFSDVSDGHTEVVSLDQKDVLFGKTMCCIYSVPHCRWEIYNRLCTKPQPMTKYSLDRNKTFLNVSYTIYTLDFSSANIVSQKRHLCGIKIQFQDNTESSYVKQVENIISTRKNGEINFMSRKKTYCRWINHR
jgi:hypothetical protein